MTTSPRRRLTIAVALAGALAFGACSDDQGGDSSRSRESSAISTGFDRVTRSQQVPTFDWSQERQTLIDVLTVRAEGAHGTAEVTALDGSLIWWCPTAGAPIPSTYQLTNPDQVLGRGGSNGDGLAIPQGEPTGIYTGDSQATYVLCLDDEGTAFARYDEGNVRWTSGVVDGLPEDRRARVDEITYEFTTQTPD
jgi:hypothetical protein